MTLAESHMVAVVTGTTQGLGLAIARHLCDKFAGKVYFTGRDVVKGNKIVEDARNVSECDARFYQLDILNTADIEEFRKYLETEDGGIDILINNAAIAHKRNATESISKEAEVTLATNFFALLNFCLILFPYLRVHGRVVNLSDSLGHLSQIPGKHLRERFADPKLNISQLKELMYEFLNATHRGDYIEEGWGDNPYAVSKVGVTALTRIQQRIVNQLDENMTYIDVLVNSCHPGDIQTRMSDFTGYFTPAQESEEKNERGAVIPVVLALIPPTSMGPAGQYIWCDGTVVDWVNGPLPGPCINRTFKGFSIHESLYAYYRELFPILW